MLRRNCVAHCTALPRVDGISHDDFAAMSSALLTTKPEDDGGEVVHAETEQT